MGSVVQPPPTDAELTEAWDAFVAANQAANLVMLDPMSTSHDRFRACVTAINLHQKFYRLCVRVEVANER